MVGGKKEDGDTNTANPNDTPASSNNSNSEPAWQMSASLKIPPFWSNRPDLWFLQIETQFRLKGITSSNTKYDYLISSLPADSMEIVADFLTNPTREGDKFENIKKLLIARCRDTEERRLDALLNRVELGDLKPSELFRQMESLAGGNSLINVPLLKKLWLNKLPQAIQPCVIAIESTHSQEEIFKIADRIYDATDRSRISAITNDPKQDDLKTLIINLTDRIKNLEARPSRSSNRSTSGRSNSLSRSKSNSRANRNTNELCWYHKRFDANAQKCQPGCTYSTKSKPSTSKN